MDPSSGTKSSDGEASSSKAPERIAVASQKRRGATGVPNCSLSDRPTTVRIQRDSPLAAAQLSHASDRLGDFLSFAERSAEALEQYVSAGEQFSRAGA